jgi:hypothetical protein
LRQTGVERIAEHRLFALRRGVGRVEDDGGRAFRRPAGDAFAESPPEFVGDAGRTTRSIQL